MVARLDISGILDCTVSIELFKSALEARFDTSGILAVILFIAVFKSILVANPDISGIALLTVIKALFTSVLVARLDISGILEYTAFTSSLVTKFVISGMLSLTFLRSCLEAKLEDMVKSLKSFFNWLKSVFNTYLFISTVVDVPLPVPVDEPVVISFQSELEVVLELDELFIKR